MPVTSSEPPGIPGIGDPLGTPLAPPGTPMGPPGTPLGPQGMPLGPPGDVPETPRGRPWDPRDLLEPLMDHKNGRISTSIQRQKLSIAAFKPASWGPAHERLDRAVLYIKTLPKILIAQINYSVSRNYQTTLEKIFLDPKLNAGGKPSTMFPPKRL